MGKHWTLSEKAKRNIRNAAIGRRWSEEAKQRVKDNWTPEKRAKASKLHSGENNHFFGKTWTPEHRVKIEEARAKLVASYSPEKLERINKRKEVMNSSHPTCQKCGEIIRRHNKMGMCWRHKNFSIYVKERRKQKYKENREEIRRKNNEYIARPEVRAKKQNYDMEYRKRNAKKIDSRVYKWRTKRMERDPLFKFKERLKSRMYSAFRALGEKKPIRSMLMLGASMEQIRKHIESQFTDGMAWENYGKWHADHVIPLSSAQTKEEMVRLCHYMNLQPLWAIDNLRKGKKIKSRP